MESIRKNYVFTVLYQFLIMVLPMVTTPYISRVLGPEAVGIYSYTHSVADYFLLAAMLGIANYGNRSVALTREDRELLNSTFSGIYKLQCITFFIGTAAYIVYLIVFARENRTIAAIQIIYFLSGLLDISWLYFGLEKFKITVGGNAIIKIGTAALILVLVKTQNDLWKYTLIMTMGVFLSQAFLWFFAGRYVAIVRVGMKDILQHLKPVLTLFVPVLAYSVYKVMDKIMLGHMASYEQVGFYTSAEKLTNIPMGIVTALGTVMLPRMASSLVKGDVEKSRKYICNSIKFVTIASSAIAFGIMGISVVLTPVFFGPGYETCVQLIKLLGISVFFIAWANVTRTQYLIPNCYDHVYIISTVIGAAVNIVLNLLLIPSMQAVGAAIGTLAAEMSVMLTQVIAVRKAIPIYKYISSGLPFLAIGLLMALLVQVIGNAMSIDVRTLFVQIVVGAVFYCIVLAAYLFVTKDDFSNVLLAIFKKRHQEAN